MDVLKASNCANQAWSGESWLPLSLGIMTSVPDTSIGAESSTLGMKLISSPAKGIMGEMCSILTGVVTCPNASTVVLSLALITMAPFANDDDV